MGLWASFTSWLSGADIPAHLQSRSQTTPPQTGVLPPARADNVVTESRALSLPTVYRAVSLIATGVSQLTVDTWRGGDPIEAPTWVRRPDIKLSRSAFLEQTTVSLALTGNAYWRVHRTSPGDPIRALTTLNPNEVIPLEDGRFSHRGKTLSDWQVQHLALMRVPGRLEGLGPIQAARLDLAGALDLRDYAAGWFSTSGVPNGVLSTDQVLSPDQAAAYKRQWMESQSHLDGPAVLGNGISYQPLMLSPKDAQFLESRQFSTTEIARLFGIPSHLMLAVVEGNSQTYMNVADADLTFVRWTLSQYLREIEESITVLLPRGQSARFNLDAILRPSTKDRYSAHQTALDAGFLTVNEVRAIEGLKPIPGGDVLAVTSTQEVANE